MVNKENEELVPKDGIQGLEAEKADKKELEQKVPKMKDPWPIYVDGSFRGKDSKSFSGYGIYYGPNDPRNESVALQEGTNNQRAELSAILHALTNISHDIEQPYILRTDSNSSIESITVQSLKWEKNGWRTKKKMFVKNRDLIEPAAKIYREIKSEYKKKGWKFQIEHVKGHSGDDGNEGADKLAILAADLAANLKIKE